jgi:fluoride exporter
VDAASVATGAVAGALLRYKINKVASNKGFSPWSTAGINIAGSLILGIVTARSPHLSQRQVLFFGTGFCGAFTTFSTYSVDVIHLANGNQVAKAISYIVLSNTLSIGAAYVGFRLGRKKI